MYKQVNRNLHHWAISHVNVDKAPKLGIMKITTVRGVRPQKMWALASFSKSKRMPTNCPLRIRRHLLIILILILIINKKPYQYPSC